MTPDEANGLVQSLIYAFANTLDADQAVYWAEFLETQDYSLTKKVLDWFKFDSGMKFMPTISEVSRQVKDHQVQISMREAARRDAGACIECEGLTWLADDPTGFIPCPTCRPSSYTRWEVGDYCPGVPPNQDELDGPKATYQMASEPRSISGPIVSKERSKQWLFHLASIGSSKSMDIKTVLGVYPEGEEIEVPGLVKKEKEDYLEF